MKIFGVSLKERIRKVDLLLFLATAVLSLISIVTILSCVENFGRSKLVMQTAMTMAGIFCLFVFANIDYKFFIDRFFIIMFLGSALLLAVTLLFGISGQNMETANRSWLKLPVIGIAIQPSEFVKIAFICTFSKHISLVKDRVNKPLVLLGLMAHAGVIVGLILLSGDLGVALVYLGIIALMLWCAGLSGWYYLALAAVVVVAFPLIWDHLQPYQQNRIIFGFQPHLDPIGYGRQPLESRTAIENGGLFGVGFSSGGMYEDLAASHTDFIFATVCEKFGYVGGFITVAALVLLSIRLLYIGFKCRDTMGRLICCGVAAVIIVQSVENLWMCLALVPVIGITLPFVSAGGSSVLATYVLIGLAHSVSAHEKKYYFGRER